MKLVELIHNLQKYEDQYRDSEIQVAFCYDKIDENLYQYMGGIVMEVSSSNSGITLHVKEHSLCERTKR